MATRSAQLAAGINLTDSSFHTVYTVPTGFTTIVKSLIAQGSGGSSTFIQWGVALAGGGTVYVATNESVTDPLAFEVDTWIVLNEGDSLVLRFIGSGSINSYIASGAQLID